MASVWVARLRGKHGFERLVAIKTILPKYASDERFQQMFLDEARIASGIDHTNVAHILDLGDEDGVVYLVMEWVDGDSLSKLLRACEKKGVAIPHGVMCRIVADLCGGLHAAHELKDAQGKPLGVVHRDVSPQNILISTKGVAKLIDFGIAKARDRLSEDTSAGQLKGKVQYMAPEQALGQKIDARADVWAMGAILYHLMAGKPAFEGENQLATLHALTSGRPPAPLPPWVQRPIVDVIKRAMSFSVDRRFATAIEMQGALERAMIEANMSTSIADVAAFSREHMSDRADARRKAVDQALRAAADRARVNDLLRAPGSDTFPTASSSSSRVPLPPASAPGSLPRGVPTVLGMPAPQLPPPASPPQPPLSFDGDGAGSYREVASVLSSESSTLGISGVMTPSPDEPDDIVVVPPPRKRIVTLLLAGAVGVTAMVTILSAITMVRGPQAEKPHAAAGAASAQPATSAHPEPTIPPPEAVEPPSFELPNTPAKPAPTASTQPATTATTTARPHGARVTAPTPAPKSTGKAGGKSDFDDGF
jgi:eukaryotic-like serine/threonine-protein kinase